MKTKYYLLLLIFIYWVTACVDDPENSNLVPVEKLIPVVIKGFDDTTVVIGSELNIKPLLENMDDENRYQYLWYAANTQTAGVAPSRDTLSMEKDLSVKIQMASGTYNLVYIVSDPTLDVYVRKTVTLTVAGSEVSKGWYVLKEIDNKTDFDYISEDGKIIKDVLKELAAEQEFVGAPVTFGNQQLSGKPLKIVYQGQRYYQEVTNPDGTTSLLANQRALHVISDEDFKTFNADNLYLFKNADTQFYEKPEVIAPNDLCFFSTDLFLINANKLYSIYGMSQNAGRYGYSKVSEYSPNYKLYPKIIATFYGAVVFDEESRSLFNASSSGSVLSFLSEPNDQALPSTRNMDYDLITILERENTNFYRGGYMLFRSRTSGNYFLATFSTMGDTSYPFVFFEEVPSNSAFTEAAVMCAPQVASCIYFANGNVLSCYIDASDLEEREKVIKTFPQDETISHISNIKSEYLTVLTNSAKGWKMYGFEIVGSTPDINPEPKFVHEGEGWAQSLMLR